MNAAPPLTGRPFLVINIIWHPASEEAQRIAASLQAFYRRDALENIGGGVGIPVLYRTVLPVQESSMPGDASEATASIILIDENCLADDAWKAWLIELEQRATASGLRSRVFPVTLTREATSVGLRTEAILWHEWAELTAEERMRRLTIDLSHQFCKMLRHWLDTRLSDDTPEIQRRKYRQPVKLFISHTKRDEEGKHIALAVREFIFRLGGIASFFDVYDIASGLEFDREILENIRDCAVVAIHTDKYSSREWCRREILEAKKHHVPLVVANCISESDDRAFPYLGNVPVIRMDPQALDRIDIVINALITESLRDFLWRCWVVIAEPHRLAHEVFVPRTPELLMLSAAGVAEDAVFVYPEPVIAAEEAALFEAINPRCQLFSMLQWVVERTS